VINDWWSCVHSYVLSAQENLFVEFKYFAQWLNLARVGVGGAQTDHRSGLKGAALYRKQRGIKGLTHWGPLDQNVTY
jgi:hypothetical protein